jgi:hypothetical protein
VLTADSYPARPWLTGDGFGGDYSAARAERGAEQSEVARRALGVECERGTGTGERERE